MRGAILHGIHPGLLLLLAPATFCFFCFLQQQSRQEAVLPTSVENEEDRITAVQPRRLTSFSDLLSSAGLSSKTAADDPHLVNCPALLDQVHRTGQQWDPNDGQLFARYTKLYPQFWISLHTFDFDKVRYGTLHWGKYYEKALSRAFTEVLTGVNDAVAAAGQKKRKLVIDVGGNIGWFSLLSAALDHDVHVFEPNVVNIIRLCESQCLNGWLDGSPTDCQTMSPMYQHDLKNDTVRSGNSVIDIRTLGLKDVSGEFWLSQTRGSFSTGAGKIGSIKESDKSIRVQVTTLDEISTRLGWLDDDTIISVLKVDVEGLEHDVFRGGRNLIQSKRVQNIFMEGNVGTDEQVELFFQLVTDFQASGYVLYKIGGSVGPANDIAQHLPHGDNDHEKFKEGLLFGCRGYERQNRFQCNLWWRLRDAKIEAL